MSVMAAASGTARLARTDPNRPPTFAAEPIRAFLEIAGTKNYQKVNLN
jgi:hypothetical protein